MVKLTIDNQEITAPDGLSILEAAKLANIHIPTLCYIKDICEVGACRVCVVEIEGDGGKLAAACNTPAEDGMVIRTNSPAARDARRVNAELLLSAHEVNCPSCVRGGNCSLQTLAENLNILTEPYEKKITKKDWPQDFPLNRNESKCVKCMRCILVCDKVQSLGVWNINGSGCRAAVGVADGLSIKDSDCVMCGQCIVKCPVGALSARDDTEAVVKALADPDKTVVVQIAPAVRAAWGESLGLSREKATVGRMVAAARKLGAEYVFDTDFSADLTIMEEGSEVLERITDKNEKAVNHPVFTSCCPGWVKFLTTQYPELTGNLSTAKSPQQMFGAAVKSWFAERSGIDPAKIFCVSIMPCVAKKDECTLPGMDSAKTGQDVDAVLTSREFVRLIKSHHINVDKLNDEDFDDVLGDASGAGVIFGATGGVMEAALRSAYFLATGKNPDPDAFKAVRGLSGTREVTADVNGIPVRVAAVSGLANARALIEKIKSGEAEYDFVEVMACPSGCVGGGGQPIKDGYEMAPERSPVLYELDKNAQIRFSHENPSIKKAYEEFFIKPLSGKSHEYLHRGYQ
jgi:NADH-quinone oxidoreductase subunit G